MNVILSD